MGINAAIELGIIEMGIAVYTKTTPYYDTKHDMGDAQGSSTQQAPNALLQSLSNTIQTVMHEKELHAHQWLKLEQFISGKAREMRTEKLKRSQPQASGIVEVTSTPRKRKILKVTRRK